MSVYRPTGDAESQVLLTEYQLVAESWRFLTGIRFAVLTFAATVLFALLSGYAYVESNLDRLDVLGQIALQVIPVFGTIVTVAVIVIEERTRSLYASCLIRARIIEQHIGLTKTFLDKGGHFQRLWDAPVPLGFASHTWAIRIIYAMILLTWMLLFFRAILA